MLKNTKDIIRHLGKFQTDSFTTERRQTDGHG